MQNTLDLFCRVLNLLSPGCIKLEALILTQALLFTIQLTSAPSSRGLNQKSFTDFSGVTPIHAAMNHTPYLL